MKPSVATYLFVLLLPTVTLLGGGRLLNAVSGRVIDPQHPPLNLRWSGYSAEDVEHYFEPLRVDGLRSERRFLEFDLVFPPVLAAALLTSLLKGSALLGWHRRGWLVALVVLGTAADWTENVSLLSQFDPFLQTGAIDPRAIAMASAGTVVKLNALGLSFLLIAVMVSVDLWRRRRFAV